MIKIDENGCQDVPSTPSFWLTTAIPMICSQTFDRTAQSRLKRTYPQSLQQQAENHPLNPSSGDGPLNLFKTSTNQEKSRKTTGDSTKDDLKAIQIEQSNRHLNAILHEPNQHTSDM